MKMLRIVPVLAIAFLSTACASGTPFGQRVLGGAAVGAGVGAAAGEIIAGAPGKGAAVGAVVGGAAGALDWMYDKDHPRPQQQTSGFIPTTSAYPQCARIRDYQERDACERGAEAGIAAAREQNVRNAEARAAQQAYCATVRGGCSTSYGNNSSYSSSYSTGCGVYCGTGGPWYSGAGSSYPSSSSSSTSVIFKWGWPNDHRHGHHKIGPKHHSGSHY